MKHRPDILSLTKMHEMGLAILREAADLRMASGLDPATLQREVVGSRRSHHSHRRGGRCGASGSGRSASGRGPAWRRLRPDRCRRRHGPGHSSRLHTRGQYPKRGRACVCIDDRIVATFSADDGGLAAGDYHVRTSMTGREIAGKSLGIIGFGRIGRRVGEIAYLGFGMKVDLSRHRPRSARS